MGRAIYDDDPTGTHVHGIRYRFGYDRDHALALWDSSGRVQPVRDTRSAGCTHSGLGCRYPTELLHQDQEHAG